MLKNLFRVLVLAAFLVAAVQSSAIAAVWRDMEVFNNTGYTISRLYVSPRGNPDWGNDLLGSNYLYNGGHSTFRYDANAQYYEICVFLKDGTKILWTGEKALNFYNSTMLVFYVNSRGNINAKVD